MPKIDRASVRIRSAALVAAKIYFIRILRNLAIYFKNESKAEILEKDFFVLFCGPEKQHSYKKKKSVHRCIY